MQTIEGLRRRIKSASDLLSVVKTMKALAAVSIRHYEHAVASLSEYNRTVELGLHIVLTAQNEWKVTEHPDLDGTWAPLSSARIRVSAASSMNERSASLSTG